VAETADILVIGGGIAGLSAAAELSRGARVTVLEAEDAPGFHSSGRSATMLHYALGNSVVRRLTLASRPFFEAPSEGFSEAPLTSVLPILVHARDDDLAELDALERDLASFTALDRLGADAMRALCPVLRVGEEGAQAGLVDRAALKLDGDALLQGYARLLRRNGSELRTGARITAVARQDGAWQVTTEAGAYLSAPVLVNAAGAWADTIAGLAGVAPAGITPRRRTIIVFDGPPELDLARLPFVKTVGEQLYFGPEAGRVFASPMDEVESDPCDAQPDEFEMALAAHRVAERTTMTVRRIEHRWAGLRSFAPDRLPVLGFAPDAPGFFWLAGQGGSGLQTAPILARMAASLILSEPWPVPKVTAAELSPARFLGQAA
jgi:D-arginine dehydrogenase